MIAKLLRRARAVVAAGPGAWLGAVQLGVLRYILMKSRARRVLDAVFAGMCVLSVVALACVLHDFSVFGPCLLAFVPALACMYQLALVAIGSNEAEAYVAQHPVSRAYAGEYTIPCVEWLQQQVSDEEIASMAAVNYLVVAMMTVLGCAYGHVLLSVVAGILCARLVQHVYERVAGYVAGDVGGFDLGSTTRALHKALQA